jgi:CHASE2 domain-containing sensor protein
MSGQFPSAIKKPVYCAVILAISLAAAGLLLAGGAIRYWDRVLYDLCINYRVKKSPQTKNPHIASIDLNDTSIKELGDALDTRQAFADILEVLYCSNAAAVLDFLFGNEKSSDMDFVRAVRNHKNTIIAALAVEKGLVNKPYEALNEAERSMLARHIWHIKVTEKGKVPQAGSFLLPFPALTEAAGQIAHINVEPDRDGIYRRVPLLYEWDGGLYSFAVSGGGCSIFGDRS